MLYAISEKTGKEKGGKKHLEKKVYINLEEHGKKLKEVLVKKKEVEVSRPKNILLS